MPDDDPLESEHRFLDGLCQRLAAQASDSPLRDRLVVGPGDDAAVFTPSELPIAATTDALVEGVHFRHEWIDPRALGRRAVAVNLSDLAATAAHPRFVLTSITAPPSTSETLLATVLDGCAEACAEVGALMIGGNLARGEALSITITALGEIPGRRLDRSGAEPGDALVVTGTLGDAAAAVATWLGGGTPNEQLRTRWSQPEARLRAGLALANAGARAAIDLSDGLLADLGHLCAASGVGAVVVRDELPRSPDVARLDEAGHDFAASGGEDYELLVACPPSVTQRLEDVARDAQTPLTVIGRCTDRIGTIEMTDASGRAVPLPAGFDHFTREPS